MRLGYFTASTPADLEKHADGLDAYGCSAVWAGLPETDDACLALGAKAKQLGIVLGETGMWENLMTDDKAKRQARIEKVRSLLRRAELAGCRCVVSLAGTKDASDAPLAPHAANYTDAFRREFREVVLRILDGLVLQTVGYGIEPRHNTFFYQPEEAREFIDSVGHPRFGLHLDQMNMVSQADFFNTTRLIEKTFKLLADKVWSVHLKDIRCDFNHMFLKWDEVRIGDGAMDYDCYLKHLAKLPAGTPCYCEHFANEGDYAVCFARLHHLAQKAGVRFLRRGDG